MNKVDNESNDARLSLGAQHNTILHLLGDLTISLVFPYVINSRFRLTFESHLLVSPLLSSPLSFYSNRDRWMSGKLVYAMHNNEGGRREEASDGQPYDDHDELNAERIHGDHTILVQVPEMAVILFCWESRDEFLLIFLILFGHPVGEGSERE